MPIRIFNQAEALANRKANEYFRWSGNDPDEPGDNPHHASTRIGTPYVPTKARSPFKLSVDGLFTVGSCFAREIEQAFLSRGYPVLSLSGIRTDPLFLEESGKAGTGFFNRYNTASMAIEFERCLGEADIGPTDLLNQVGENLYEDIHYTRTFPASPLEDCLRRRQMMREAFQSALNANVFVLTLGLNEVWFDRESGRYANIMPRFGRRGPPDRFECHALTVAENVEQLGSIYDLLTRTLEHDFKMIVTVSPVSLDSTFMQDDIIVSNCKSKSILRASAAEFCQSRPNVAYFQSYEIAMFSALESAFRADRQHVRRKMVEHIIKTFLRDFVDPL